MNLGYRNTFVCPRCGHEWEEHLSASDYEDGSDDYCCPECDFECITIELETDYWYEQNAATFAEQYLRLRGYAGDPKSWYALSSYLEHFLDGRKEVVKQWKGEQWVEAYEILQEYFDRDPDYKKVKCTGCGEEHPIEDCFSSTLDYSREFSIRCSTCGKPENRYKVPCEFVKEILNDRRDEEAEEREETEDTASC